MKKLYENFFYIMTPNSMKTLAVWENNDKKPHFTAIRMRTLGKTKANLPEKKQKRLLKSIFINDN